MNLKVLKIFKIPTMICHRPFCEAKIILRLKQSRLRMSNGSPQSLSSFLIFLCVPFPYILIVRYVCNLQNQNISCNDTNIYHIYIYAILYAYLQLITRVCLRPEDPQLFVPLCTKHWPHVQTEGGLQKQNGPFFTR